MDSETQELLVEAESYISWCRHRHQRCHTEADREQADGLIPRLSRAARAVASLKARGVVLPPGVLVSAVRYALHRSTYVVEETVAAVEAVWSELPQGTRSVIFRDVRQGLERGGGMECDRRSWGRLLALEHEPGQVGTPETKVCGIPVRSDPSVPPDQVQVRDDAGRIVAAIDWPPSQSIPGEEP